MYRDLGREHPAQNEGWTAELTPYSDVVLGDTKAVVLLVQAAALVIFLIGCIDVVALLTARALDRADEIRLRRALGATPGRLLRQSILESGLLSLTGGVLAIATTAGAMRFLSQIELPTRFSFPLHPRLSGTVLGAAVGLSLATGLVLGLVSALGAGRSGPMEGSRSSRKRGRGLPVAIVSQIALAMAVLSAGGLLLEGLVSLEHAELGFDPANVLSIGIHRPHEYESLVRQREFQSRLLDEVGALPGVEQASVALYPPLAPVHMNLRFDIEGRASEGTDTFSAESLLVSEAYFRTLRARFLEGRGFGDEDRPQSPGALVVNETLAREYWPGEDAVGKRIFFHYPELEGRAFTVVGVVQDIVQARLTRRPARTLYLSQRETGLYDGDVALIVRTSGSPLSSLPAIRRRISSVDPDVVIRDATPMMHAAYESLEAPRQRTILLAGFGAVALLLAASGLYGLLAFTIAKGGREIGIRMALGARPKDVARLVTGRATRLALAGTAIGLALSWLGARFLERLLYGVSAYDALPYALTAVVLLVTALTASYVPARRASRIEPWKALRQE